MKMHELKLNHKYYDASEKGIKNFEIRKNDRDFKVGDVLALNELHPMRIDGRIKLVYSGRRHYKVITYILDDEEYLKDGYVCLGLAPIAESFEVTGVE